MSDKTGYLRKSPFWQISAFTLFGLLLLARFGYAQSQLTEQKNVTLQGTIQLVPTKEMPGGAAGQIQPGTHVKFVVEVENNGPNPTPNGELFVQYAFAYPLDKEDSSVLFESEKKELPSIEPGKTIKIAFDASHQIPSLFDFIRNDWTLREYKAVALIDKKEHLIGTLALTFSAYYYPGKIPQH